MTTYLVKRLLLMIPTLFGITMITFLIIRLAPGDPVAARMGAAGFGMGTEGGDTADQINREQQVIRTKKRLGLLGDEGTIRVWSPEEKREIHVIGDHEAAVNDLAFSPDGSILAAAMASGQIILRNAATYRIIRTLEGHQKGVNAIAFCRNGTLIASASDDTTAKIWRVETGEAVATCTGHEYLVRCVAFSPDGATVATGSRDSTVRLWDSNSGTEIASFDDHILEVTGVLFTPSGDTLFSASRDRLLHFRDPAQGRQTRAVLDLKAAIRSLALSDDGALLAAGLGDNTVALINTANGEVRARLRGHHGAVDALAFGPANLLASASRDKSVGVWDVGGERLLGMLTRHTDRVRAVAFSPSGDAIASGALDLDQIGLLKSYWGWLTRLVKLDFGRSFRDDRLVWDKIREAMPVTLELNIIAFFIIYLLSIPLGVFSAARRDSVADHTMTVGLFMLYSMPSFWVATLLIIVLGSPRGPSGGVLPFVNLHGENSHNLPFLKYQWDHMQHLVLPLLALTYHSFAFLSRLVRSSLLEVLSQDYIRTARAKGLPETTVVGQHGLRNSLIPVVTVFGNLLPAMIGGSVIIEGIYSLPGMGWLGFQAILQRDYPVIMGITTLVAVLTMVGILLSDILYCLVDPRIKLD